MVYSLYQIRYYIDFWVKNPYKVSKKIRNNDCNIFSERYNLRTNISSVNYSIESSFDSNGMLLLLNNKKVMGEYRNNLLQNVFAIIGFILICTIVYFTYVRLAATIGNL
jgi:hypothetical protein